jgi:hypothetical protein
MLAAIARSSYREMKVEHSNAIKDLTDEQLERSIELIRRLLCTVKGRSGRMEPRRFSGAGGMSLGCRVFQEGPFGEGGSDNRGNVQSAAPPILGQCFRF